MNPMTGLNATFAAQMARPGSVGLVSQSGALLTAVLDWAEREALGFSTIVSLGSMLDVGWGDVIYYLGDDPHTKSIVMYMETIGDARAFLSAAREVAITDADADRYAAAVEVAAANPESDGLLVILTPQAMTDATGTAERLATSAKVKGRPVLASWMGAGVVEAGAARLRRSGIPVFPYPDDAAAMFNYTWRYADNLRALYETPALPDSAGEPGRAARIVLHDPALSETDLPRPAIRPYPRQYVAEWKAPDGAPVTIRPIRPEDEPLMVRFHQALSDETVHARYFSLLKLSERTAHERLARVCFIDYDRVMALVAEHIDPASGELGIVAVGRLIKAHGVKEAEFALLVADGWQRCGLGSELLRRLIGVGRDEGLVRISADILASNAGMLRVSQRAGFTLRRDPQTATVEATLSL